MITIHCTKPAATSASVELTFTAKTGQSLMKAALAADVNGIAADCGGSLTCATCHVYVAENWSHALPAASADELAMLELTAAPRAHNSRLSCQLLMTPDLNGLCITLPLTQY